MKLGSADLADSNIIAAAQQLEINDVLNRVARCHGCGNRADNCADRYLRCNTYPVCAEILSLDIKTLDIVEKVCFKQRIHIGLNRMRTGLCLAVASSSRPSLTSVLPMEDTETELPILSAKNRIIF